MNRSKKKIGFFLGSLLGIFILYYILSISNFNDLLNKFSEIDSYQVILSSIFFCLFYFFQSLKLKSSLNIKHNLSYVFFISNFTYLLNFAVFLQLGEIFKISKLKERFGLKSQFILSAIIVTRIIDLLIICFLTSIGFLIILLVEPFKVDHSLIVLFILIILLLCFFSRFYLYILKGILKFFIDEKYFHINSFLKKTRNYFFYTFEDTHTILKKSFRQMFLLGMCGWFCNFLGMIVMFPNLIFNFNFFKILKSFGMIQIGLSIPITPASIGHFEALWLLYIRKVLDSSVEKIISLSLTSHSINILVVVSITLISFFIISLKKQFFKRNT